jgi:hypothetical protein
MADAVGKNIVERNFEALHALFAPGFQMSAAELGRMVDEANEGLAPPKQWTLDENPIDLASLREPDGLGPPSKPLPEEITDANFAGWLCVQLQPDPDNEEGFDVCFDVWVAAVRQGGKCLVGYLEAWEAT